MFDISNFKKTSQKTSRYERRINQLQERKGLDTKCIEHAIEETIDNINNKATKSLVIYGEPQSGKTEMMIALSAKLLDTGHRIIIVLLNDNVHLLNQNLKRFKESGIDPTPKNFSEILDHSVHISNKEWIIFCKKNSSDLKKLIYKLDGKYKTTIIDDEADYASPNSKINQKEVTTINRQINDLLGHSGIYIGVTATPARLNLNNTFNNDSNMWVNFPAHDYYTGQDIFFPLPNKSGERPKHSFIFTPISDQGDSPKYLRRAFFGFLINVAHLNLEVNSDTGEKPYAFLVHTSGKKIDHSDDYKTLQKIINILTDQESKNFGNYIKQIWELAEKRFPNNANEILFYIIENITRNDLIVMNSDTDKKNTDMSSATTPSSLFTVVIGGNTVSRGVTFENLLSMFFTRDVKHKLQQDTYIQRARMFGSRGKELKYFELTIPNTLYEDWHKCFLFHRLALDSIKNGCEAPVWLEDHRVSSVASTSINKSTVDIDKGEMSYALFDYRSDLIKGVLESDGDNYHKLHALQEIIGLNSLPAYLIEYIKGFSPLGVRNLIIHPISSVMEQKNTDHEMIIRERGMFGGSEIRQHPDAIHHIKIYYNNSGKARLFYKYVSNIKFLKNKGGTSKEVAA